MFVVTVDATGVGVIGGVRMYGKATAEQPHQTGTIRVRLSS